MKTKNLILIAMLGFINAKSARAAAVPQAQEIGARVRVTGRKRDG